MFVSERGKGTMRARYFTPLAAFVVPSLVIGFGVVIPGSCIEGVNQLTVGFASSLASAAVAYWLGIRAVLSDRPREPEPR
jgi:ABC-type Fe3+ transport system permease subunit